MSYVKKNWKRWDPEEQNIFIDCMKICLTDLDPSGKWQQWSLYQRWLAETRVWLPMRELLTRAEAYELAIALHEYLEDLFVPF